MNVLLTVRRYTNRGVVGVTTFVVGEANARVLAVRT